jgi:biotin carboxyl carrier protein
VDASRNAAGGAWILSGDLTGELTMRNGGFTFNGKPLQRASVAQLQTAAPPSVDETAHGHTGAAAGGRIVSPMPGKIVKITVREGDTVEAHDLLIVLEAMKMEHRIEAPGDGVVKRIAVREGEIVAGSAPILDIE